MTDTTVLEASWASFARLIDPVAGLIQSVIPLPLPPGATPVSVFGARLGDLAEVFPNVEVARAFRRTRDETDGAAGDKDPALARVVSAAEAVERYASCRFHPDDVRWAAQDELPARSLSLDAVPRCSEAELAHPRCVLRAPEPAERIRWVEGISLHTGEKVWLPAVMVYLHIPIASPAERFWLPISTGCAGHFDPYQAVLNAVLEVVERDAISVVWHQMLALPRVDLSSVGPAAVAALEVLDRSCVELTFFDATFEHGIPVVYALERSPHDPDVHQLVMCAVDLDPSRAIAKIVREAASSRIALASEIHRRKPTDLDGFINVSDGALFMAPQDKAAAFDFLCSRSDRRRCGEFRVAGSGSSKGDLGEVLDRLERSGHEAFAVDLSTDECRRIGFSVVRVVIPSMQPLSFAFRAQFRAHPRLYEVPEFLGLPVRREDELNPWPQPFA